MLSIARHEGAKLFWCFWWAAEGTFDADLWDAISPSLGRLDALLEDPDLQGHHRGALAPTLNALRDARGTPRDRIEGHLRRLANVVLSLMEADYEFKPSVLPAGTYLKVLRAAQRADEEGLDILSHCTGIGSVVRYARIDLPTARVGIGKMVDEGLAEYEFDAPDGTEEAFRILDDGLVAGRIDELEESQMLETKFTVKHAEPLRPDYENLIRGLAMKHDVIAEGSPTGSEVIVKVSDYGGDEDSFKARVVSFATELELALSRSAPAPVAMSGTSVIFQGPVINSPVQAGSPGASQQVHNQVSVDMDKVRLCFAEAKRALGDMDLDDETREIVDTQLATVDKQLAKAEPNPKLVLPFVTSIATALATTGAVGQGLDYIHKLIELLAGLG